MNRKLKDQIKRFIPDIALKELRRRKVARSMKQFSAIDSASTFDKIYRERLWGVGTGDVLSGDGTASLWADSAIADITRILDGRSDLTICDVGCGDFVVGRRVAGQFSRYYALDVSKHIIDLNRQKYAHLSNVEFIHKNASDGDLPWSDVYLIRQVLQHTTNAQIKRIVAHALDQASMLVIVFEDVPSADFVPNLDLPTDGPFTRNAFGSGVDLRAPPFGFPFQVFSETPHPDDTGTKLVCYLSRVRGGVRAEASGR